MRIKVEPSSYSYSEPIVIKEWPGGKVTASVGYVTNRPANNQICLEKTWRGQGGKRESQKYNIRRGDWAGIKKAIEKLLPEIGETPTEQDIGSAIEKVSRETQ